MRQLNGLVVRALGALRPVGAPVAPAHTPGLPAVRRVALPGRGELDVLVADGPPGTVPVLLLHGVTWTAALNYHQVFDALAGRHPVISIDHRGHGDGLPVSGRFAMADLADDAVAVLDELGVDRAIVVGFSLGSMTALHIGVRHPDRVAGLVLTAGCLCFAELRWERVLLAVGAPVMAIGERLGPFRDLPARYLGKNRGAPEFRRAWPWIRSELARSPFRTTMASVRAAAVHDVRPEIEQLRTCPSAVVVTRQDVLIPAGRQYAMGEALGSTIVEIDTDHEAPLTHPELYRDAVLAGIDAVVARQAPQSEAG